uniref:Uncharacterized protein n=1 Tax=Populus trichocarpa TaxID=3694 RepID=A0A2K1ZQT0_POPTR
MPLVFLVCFVLFGCALLFAVFEPPFLGSRCCSSCGWSARFGVGLGCRCCLFLSGFSFVQAPVGFFVHVLCLLVLLGVAGRVLLAAAWVLLADYAASSVFVDELACVTGSSAADKLGSCF